MNILVIDGQGGQLGGQLIRLLKDNFKEVKIVAVGTNATATASMLKAGADQAATGENPVIVACRKADAWRRPRSTAPRCRMWQHRLPPPPPHRCASPPPPPGCWSSSAARMTATPPPPMPTPSSTPNP